MSFGLIAILLLTIGAMYFTGRVSRSRPSDFEEIEAFAKSRKLQVISVNQNNGRWRYWLRGQLLVSNLARTFIVIADSPDGGRREIHVAFDPWGFSKGIQVLQERQIAVEGTGAKPAG